MSETCLKFCIDESAKEAPIAKVWIGINPSEQVNGAIRLVFEGDSVECELEESKPNVGATSIAKKDEGIKKDYWARVIRDHVDEVAFKKTEPSPRENLVSDVFEYMSILKFEDKNVYKENNERKVHNDYSFAELDLLFCIICALKYYCPAADYNYEGLKTMLNLCRVNYWGISPLEVFFGDASVDEDNENVDEVALKVDSLVRNASRGALVASDYFSLSDLELGCTYIRGYDLMIEAYREFMTYPLSERDEAVKMLAWRLI